MAQKNVPIFFYSPSISPEKEISPSTSFIPFWRQIWKLWYSSFLLRLLVLWSHLPLHFFVSFKDSARNVIINAICVQRNVVLRCGMRPRSIFSGGPPKKVFSSIFSRKYANSLQIELNLCRSDKFLLKFTQKWQRNFAEASFAIFPEFRWSQAWTEFNSKLNEKEDSEKFWEENRKVGRNLNKLQIKIEIVNIFFINYKGKARQ